MEIEKKYLIAQMPDLSAYKCHEIEQAYLNRNPVLRIRRKDSDFIFTYKLKKKNELNLVENVEIEEELTEEAYYHLRDKADGFPIFKTRYLIPLEGGLTGELDVFHGRLEGLVFIEVEFPDEKTAVDFVPPKWFGTDVSSDRHYRNGWLSTLEKYNGFLNEPDDFEQ